MRPLLDGTIAKQILWKGEPLPNAKDNDGSFSVSEHPTCAREHTQRANAQRPYANGYVTRVPIRPIDGPHSVAVRLCK
jgi:hypothetical protein